MTLPTQYSEPWAAGPDDPYGIEPCEECGALDRDYGQHEPGCPSGFPTREDEYERSVREYEDEHPGAVRAPAPGSLLARIRAREDVRPDGSPYPPCATCGKGASHPEHGVIYPGHTYRAQRFERARDETGRNAY